MFKSFCATALAASNNNRSLFLEFFERQDHKQKFFSDISRIIKGSINHPLEDSVHLRSN